MQYLLTPIGSGGDVRPFVAIGRRLVEGVLEFFPEGFGRPQRDWPPQTLLTGFPIAPPTHEAIEPDLET